MKNENINLKKRIIELELELKLQIKNGIESRKLANFDFLTNIANRGSFTRSLKDMLEDLKEKEYPFTMIYIDLDNFKLVNDTYSHKEGDNVLRAVSNLLILENRAHTLIGRLGGEEFGVAIPGGGVKEGLVVAERIRLAIEGLSLEGIEVSVTASIGVYEPTDKDSIEDTITKADNAMYISKTTGKNKVTLYNED